jgi:hypothetical protein
MEIRAMFSKIKRIAILIVAFMGIFAMEIRAEKVTVVIKNNSGDQVEIDDLSGLTIPDGGQVTASALFDLNLIYHSDDLLTLALDETLVINDGAADISTDEIEAFLSEYNVVRNRRDASEGSFLSGFLLSYVSANVVQTTAGWGRDATGFGSIVSAGTLTADISVSGVGGLDTGTEAALTWYAVHVIGDADGVNATALLFSLSVSAPSLPVGYETFRRLGWVRNNNAGSFWPFYQAREGRSRAIYYNADYTTLQQLTDGTATTFTDVSLASVVPSGINEVFLNVAFSNGLLGVVTDQLFLRADGSTTNPNVFFMAQGILSVGKTSQFIVFFSPNQTVEYKVTNATNNAADIYVIGYVDNL